MNYTATDMVLIITAIGLVINNIITSWKTNTKISALTNTTEVIAGHVNSAATKANADREASAAREAALIATMSEMKTSAALLAQALAVKNSAVPVQTSYLQPGLPVVAGLPTTAIEPVAAAVVDSLDAIKDSTDAIDRNTRKKETK